MHSVVYIKTEIDFPGKPGHRRGCYYVDLPASFIMRAPPHWDTKKLIFRCNQIIT